MAYSLTNKDGAVAFFKDGKLHWKLDSKVNMCESPQYSLRSSDGCRIAFCGWRIVQDIEDPDDEELTCPITAVLDIENLKFLRVYEGHIQPLAWNASEDDLLVPSDCAAYRSFEGREWGILYDCLPELPSQRESSEKWSHVSSVSEHDREAREHLQERLALWEQLAPGYDTGALEREFDHVRHVCPWAERSSDSDVCRRVVSCLVHGISYQQQSEEYAASLAARNASRQKEQFHAPASDTSPDELRQNGPSKKRLGFRNRISDNVLVVLSVIAVSVFWIWGSVALYRAGHHDAATGMSIGGTGVLVAIVSRIAVLYESRFERKFLMWRIIVACVALFSTAAYQAARLFYRLLNAAFGLQMSTTFFACEFAVLLALAIFFRIKGSRADSKTVGKRWAWAETAAVVLIIGAFLCAVYASDEEAIPDLDLLSVMSIKTVIA